MADMKPYDKDNIPKKVISKVEPYIVPSAGKRASVACEEIVEDIVEDIVEEIGPGTKESNALLAGVFPGGTGGLLSLAITKGMSKPFKALRFERYGKPIVAMSFVVPFVYCAFKEYTREDIDEYSPSIFGKWTGESDGSTLDLVKKK